MTMKKAVHNSASAFQRRGSGSVIAEPYQIVLENNHRGVHQDRCGSTLLAVTTMRTYGDGCGIAHGLDLVGERWALLVVRELVLGPKRFTDLRGGLPNASPNVLAQRLRELEQVGIVRRRRLPPPAGSSVYELTDWGRGLEPVVRSLGAWAVRSPAFPRGAPVSVDSVVLALQTFFDGDAAEGLDARYDLRLGEDRFQITIADGTIEVARGQADGADVTIETDVAVLAAVLWNGREPDDALDAGDMTVEGDAQAARRFFTLFPQPEPAVAG
jgi:DNA-binding HxlR family transcriptional regulator/putative sterol carrier protein